MATQAPVAIDRPSNDDWIKPRAGDAVRVSYQGVTATGTYISAWHDLRAVVRLDGTEEAVTVPRAWVAREREK